MEYKGLNKNEVINEQKKGFNEINEIKQESKFLLFIRQFQNPILVILIFASMLSAFSSYLESHSYFESILILIIVFVNVYLGYSQDIKAINVLDSLKKLSEVSVNVIRDNEDIKIPARELVVGDIYLFKIGDIIKADLQVLEASGILVDESFLTGETDLLVKEKDSIIYSNSPIKNGQGIGTVVAIGLNTEIGKIAKEVISVTEEKSTLVMQMEDISKKLLAIAIFMSSIVFVLSLLNSTPLLDSFKNTIIILVSIVPEGLPTVLSIVLTITASKTSKKNALIKDVRLLETLGQVDYVCSDKTGTLTENKMQVVEVYNVHKEYQNFPLIVVDEKSPTENAVFQYFKDKEIEYKIIEIMPFNSTNKFSGKKVIINNEKFVILIGAPDVLSLICKDNFSSMIETYASEGLRSFAAIIKKCEYSIEEAIKDKNFELISLFGIKDPIRKEAFDTIQIFKNAQIKTVMITGDHLLTATSIAKELGIMEDGDFGITGEDLEKMSDAEFFEKARHIRVYARVKPEDKVRIVRTLQKHGDIVAMTGDGTNDSIALKQANVGIAMGINGTDISKDAANLILLDDNFKTIATAIRSGRLIYDNIKKFITQMLSVNTANLFTIIFSLLFSLLFNTTSILPLTPILILWVNVISDGLPSLSLGFEVEESNLMKKPPRLKSERILDSTVFVNILIRGLFLGLLVFLTFNLFYKVDVIYAQTCAFIVLSFGQLIGIFDSRHIGPLYKYNPFSNKLLNYFVLTAIIIDLIAVFTPLNNLLGLSAISLFDFITCLAIALVPTIAITIYKSIKK